MNVSSLTYVRGARVSVWLYSKYVFVCKYTVCNGSHHQYDVYVCTRMRMCACV